ncbi:MAG: hypothetical protein IPP39_16720 [Chitinophagaceae bacterium]|nr:hypothetical protein [Chitinophagaceae bacterium]
MPVPLAPVHQVTEGLVPVTTAVNVVVAFEHIRLAPAVAEVMDGGASRR